MLASRSGPWSLLLSLLVLAACRTEKSVATRPSPAQLRRSFKTQVFDVPSRREPAPLPPEGVFERVRYSAPLGDNVAYVSPVRPGPRRPAVLWLAGGLEWSVGESAWAEAPRGNDQSARAFREAGAVLMLPALRGCNDNPGAREYFLGEVEDVLAALDFLRSRPDVDPERVYLGGHSTGATLALLVAASGPKLAGVLAFGPIDDVSRYGETGTALDRARGRELELRNPVSFMAHIRAPTLILEGERHGNTFAFKALAQAARGAPVGFVEVPGGTHFDILAPLTELLAARVVRGDPAAPPTRLGVQEARQALRAGTRP